MSHKTNTGFTLVELIVVMSIISLLASVVLANVNGYIAKAKDGAALTTGIELAKAIQICDINGGKVTVPNSATNPTNNLCTIGNYGIWPKAPQGWTWDSLVYTSGDNDLMGLFCGYSSGKYMYCGHYPTWVDSYTCPYSGWPGLCRLEQGWGCTIYNPSTGIWE